MRPSRRRSHSATPSGSSDYTSRCLWLDGPTKTSQEPARLRSRGAERERAYRRRGFDYARIQATRPQTIGYALDDSPVGLLAWVGEKLLEWSGVDESGEPLLDDDAVLSVVSTYWLTRTATTAARMYHSSLRMALSSPVATPTVCSIFGGEMIRTPRAAVARRYDLRAWREVPTGGHFPALEVPDLFSAEVRAAIDMLVG